MGEDGGIARDSSEDLDQNNNNNNPIRTSGGRCPFSFIRSPSGLRNIKLQATHGVKGNSF